MAVVPPNLVAITRPFGCLRPRAGKQERGLGRAFPGAGTTNEPRIHHRAC